MRHTHDAHSAALNILIIRTRGAVRVVRAPKKERGFLRGLLSVAKSPLELLSLVTLLRNTKESNAHPGRGKILIIKSIMPSAQRKEFIYYVPPRQRQFLFIKKSSLPRQWQNKKDSRGFAGIFKILYLKIAVFGRSVIRDNIADIFHSRNVDQESLKAHAEA